MRKTALVATVVLAFGGVLWLSTRIHGRVPPEVEELLRDHPRVRLERSRTLNQDELDPPRSGLLLELRYGSDDLEAFRRFREALQAHKPLREEFPLISFGPREFGPDSRMTTFVKLIRAD